MNYAKKQNAVNAASGILKRIELFLLLIALLFIASTIYDMHAFTGQGKDTEGFRGFDVLLSENPDTVAWIRMDGTHIDHPVVQGEDNFEYIDKGFDREFYQGGAIFLDEKNAYDMSDSFLIIHGHHMSRGAMFSDISNYLDESFFNEYKTGELLTPNGDYALTVMGVNIANAYNDELYYVGSEPPLRFVDECRLKRSVDFAENDKLVLLSTCAGDMTNDRVVLFCRARSI